MRTRIVLSALAAAFLLAPVSAEEKAKGKDKKDALIGAFSKKAGDYELTFDFKKDSTFNFKMKSDENGVDIDFKYAREKDGTLKTEIVKFEKIGNFPVEKEKGYKMSFKVKLDGKKLTISDIEGEGVDDEAKNVLGGEYEMK